MCVKATDEGCVLKEQLQEVKADVAGLDTRLTKVEQDVGEMRTEAQNGFRAISVSLSNLAHDFGQRMNTIDTRLVAEKEKWGETLRRILTWTAITILAGCGVAMGVTVYQNFIK